MANIRTWLEDAERDYGETIEAMVVGQHDNRRWDEPARADENIVMSREVGLKKVDEEYNNSYGGADCYPIWAWTKSRVFFIAEYDGSTGLSWVPRHPTDGKPAFSGNS